MNIEIEYKKTERIYPYFGKNESGTIVAFTAPQTGVVVATVGGIGTGRYLTNLEEHEFTPMYPNPQPEPKPIPLEQRTYPYVGKSHIGQSVLFTMRGTGLLINKEKETLIGYCSKELDEELFNPIPVEKITITF